MFETYKEAAAQQPRSGAPAADPTTTPLAEDCAQQDRYFQSLHVDPPRMAASRDFQVGGAHGDTPICIVYPRTHTPLHCIVFVRGSGFWAGGIDSHVQTIHTLAHLSGCAVCAVDYRRTPEYAYPVQRDEVLAGAAVAGARGRTARPALHRAGAVRRVGRRRRSASRRRWRCATAASASRQAWSFSTTTVPAPSLPRGRIRIGCGASTWARTIRMRSPSGHPAAGPARPASAGSPAARTTRSCPTRSCCRRSWKPQACRM